MKRIRITIEVDTLCSRETINGTADLRAVEIARNLGELVYCSTEYVAVDDGPYTALFDHRGKRR